MIGLVFRTSTTRRRTAFDPKIDLVGADRAPVAAQVYFAGAVKWLNRPFDGRDLADLQQGAMSIPGYSYGGTALIAVSAVGVAAGVAEQLALCWGPQEVVAAYE